MATSTNKECEYFTKLVENDPACYVFVTRTRTGQSNRENSLKKTTKSRLSDTFRITQIVLTSLLSVTNTVSVSQSYLLFQKTNIKSLNKFRQWTDKLLRTNVIWIFMRQFVTEEGLSIHC